MRGNFVANVLSTSRTALSPPPDSTWHYCAFLFCNLESNDPNLALRECEGIDGKGPYSMKKANEQDELYFPDDNLLDLNAGGTFITFK